MASNNRATILRSAVGRNGSVQNQAPYSLGPRRTDQVRHIEELQSAGRRLTRTLEAVPLGSLPDAEEELIRHKGASIDAAIARQISLTARRVGTNRQGSIATLNDIFKLGDAPQPALSGRFRGQLLTPALFAPLDTFGRLLSSVWLPWQGKRFDAAASAGDNVFTKSIRWVGRIYWPTFSGYFPYRPGLVTAFPFNTSIGEGVANPGLSTLKLDYDNPGNPRFLVRSVLDELVQISDNYYLGKAYLRLPGGRYKLAAFFALQREK